MRDQTNNMALQGIFILSLLVIQTLSAPTGCTESCNSYVRQYQSQSGSLQDHADLSQTASRLQGLDYSRPGTWSEHNDYNTDNGHGKVHEERGQIVSGPKTVRFYKKNYASSYNTGYSNGAGQLNSDFQNNNYRHGVPTIEDLHLNSRRTYSQIGNTESIAQRESNAKSSQHYQRLEDFGEYNGNSQVIHQDTSNLNTQTAQAPYYSESPHRNWSTVDSYKTDAGHGRVFEEQGQFVSGGKKVNYYKRNYTSSYTSPGGIPIPEIAITGAHDVHENLEKLHREIGQELNHMSVTRNIASGNTLQQSRTQNLATGTLPINVDTLHNADSNIQHSQINHSNNYRNPSQNAYGTKSYSTYERHEGHMTNIQPGAQYILPTSGYTNVLNTGSNGYNKHTFNEGNMRHQIENLQQAELLNSHQSRLTQNQMTDDTFRRNIHNQNGGTYLNTPGSAQHYEEHWRSSHTSGSSVPNYNSNIMQNLQQQNGYSQQYRESGYNSAHHTNLGKLVTGTLGSDHGVDTVDCNSEHIKYKRNAKDEKSIEMQQQFDDFTEQTDKLEFGQQSADLTQQTSGKLEFGQQSYQPWKPSSANQHSGDFTQQTDESDDLTQQTSGKLELGQQSYQPWKPDSANQHSGDFTQQTDESDDLTQQTSGKLEFGQQSYQPWKPGSANQHSGDLTQQTDQSDDLTQQTSGKLEFGQQSYQPWKPSSANQHSGDFTQQTDESDDLTQQTSGKLELGQQSYQPWKPGSANQHSGDLTQQTDQSDDLTQQTSGKLELGQQSYQPWKPASANQHSGDFTQQTDESDDMTQQTSGKLELGQQSYQPWKPGSANQHSGDLTQQTDQSDDLTQQTSGKLEFGQQSYQPWKPGSANQHSGDLTQQTDQSDDLTQQTSGKLELGQQSYQPWKPGSANQHSGDLTQQTDQSDDLTQQTSGKLELGQQSYQPWKPGSANQHSGDLTQQTDQSDDLTQQTSGKLELGQQSYQPWKPASANQHSGDFTQQTDESDDMTQQTSGKLELGQQSYQPWKPGSANQHSGDLTQQTDQSDDLTQQTSGKLEFGQQSYQPWKPGSANQHSGDLTQQTDQSDDLTQQTSGKLELGQQSYQPWKPGSANQHSGDLTQQTDQSDELTQQTSGKLELGQQSYQPWKPDSANQHSGDFTQQTDESDDLTQQTSGKLEFGQQSYQPWKPGSANQHSGDLTQQTDQSDDLTQQTSGKLEFGQQSYQPWKPGSANQHSRDLTQQTDQSDDMTQQTSGKLELGQQSYQPWKPGSANQHSGDLTQQTDQSDDLTQQTSGKLELGQQSYQPWKPASANQHSGDFTQQTDESDDMTQQTSGKLELGQQSYQPWKPGSANQHSGDLTQQTDQSDDLTQQTSGKLELGQQSYQPWKPGSANQHSGDLTQQTDQSDDLTQQTSGKLEFGQQLQHSYQSWIPNSAGQYSDSLTQQTDKFGDFIQQTAAKMELGQDNLGHNVYQHSGNSQMNTVNYQQLNQQQNEPLLVRPGESMLYFLNPAEKPGSRLQYQRIDSLNNVEKQDLKPSTITKFSTNNQESSSKVETESKLHNIRNSVIRGDQSAENSTAKDTNLDQQSAGSVFEIEGESNQGNLLHKSNDATVGLSWHYTYHPSDQRQFVQQTDQKDKDDLQQSSTHTEFPSSNYNFGQQETQNKYPHNDEYQQSSNTAFFQSQYNQNSESYHQSAELELVKKLEQLLGTQTKDQLEFDQQTHEIKNHKKQVESTEGLFKLEPRILQAYGGGPYEASHTDDIYSGVTINPSATLPPVNGADPWDIREKPREMPGKIEEVTSTEPSPVIPLTTPTETPTPPSFWSRIGHKLTNTFQTAKEKAKDIFG